MAHLSLSFLGPLQVTLDGRPVIGFASAKVRALLAYLAVQGDRPQPRETLADLLWPDWPDRHALSNLRHALSNLRQCIGDSAAPVPFLLVDRENVRCDRAAAVEIDALTLQRQTEAARGLPAEQALPLLESAVALYRGPFLQGFALPDSAPFEQWLTTQREHWQREALAVLEQLAEMHEGRGAYARAQAHARRAVELEPTREAVQRRLMRALALGGDRGAALTQYEACKKVLAGELGAAPDAETTALQETIRQGKLVGPIHELALSTHLSPDMATAADDVADSPRPLFVAREQELARLGEWLDEALRGEGRVGFVVGEPGSGKTMLLREFAWRAMEAHPELVAAGGSCNAYGGVGDPYLPFVELLRLLIGDVEGQRAVGALSREHARRLCEIAPRALQAVLQVGPALIDALLPAPALRQCARGLAECAMYAAQVEDALAHRAPASSQAFLFDQATRVLHGLARERPLLLILDDLQWADTGSISLLFHLARRLAGHRILVLGAYRPEEVAAERDGQPHPLAAVLGEMQVLWEDIAVDLAQADGPALVQALVEREPNRLDSAFREALYRRTGGHALFTAELLRGLQDRGDLLRDAAGSWNEGPSLDWDRLPRRVEGVIAAHIARLPREQQELLTVASIEGEEFHAEVVARVLHGEEQEVIAALSGALSQEHRLLRAISLRRLGEQRFSRYRFRHYLFQRYLYQRTDPVRRAQLHGEVAGTLEALGASAAGAPDFTNRMEDLADTYDDLQGAPEALVSEARLAWHYEQAGLAHRAAYYHIFAARREHRLTFDYEDSLRHMERGLELLRTLPESPWRARHEQRAYIGLAASISFTKGCWIAPESGQALELADQMGDKLIIADTSTWAAYWYYVQCGEMDTALALNERAVSLAEGGPEGWVSWVRGELARTLLYRGDLSRAAQFMGPVVNALREKGSILPWTEDIVQLVLVPRMLWCLGYPDQALQVARLTRDTILREVNKFQVGSDSFVLCTAICFLHQLRYEVDGVEQALKVLRLLVQEHRVPPARLPDITLYEGWVHAASGSMEQGIAELRQGLADWSRARVIMRPYHKSHLAAALARAGHADEGVSLLEEALEQVERTNERWNEAELHRLEGELMLQQGADPEIVECCYRQATAVAQKQEAKSWELRATTSLVRLLRTQGRAAEAREALAAIYGWFTEGFDTPDLIEAKNLLRELRMG